MEESYHNPILKRKPPSPTEAELLAWRELSRDPTEFWKVPCGPRPYVRFTDRKGIEVGLKGTF